MHMATHSSPLAWKIPWVEEPGRLQSMGSLRVRHNWGTSLSLFTFMHWRRKWQPTPVFLPGESQGRGSLVGCCLWGRTELDTTEAIQQQQHTISAIEVFAKLIILMHSKCINHSFERLPTSGVARNKHLFLHLILDTVLLAQQIMELLVFARINGSCWRSRRKKCCPQRVYSG